MEGKNKYLRNFVRVLRNQKGDLKGLIGVAYDITEDKMLQMKLESSLEEKNVLVKEVHHRVKNNLQLISSILALKSYELEESRSKSIFDEVDSRIKAMSVVHDKLYTFKNVSEIDLNEYLNHISSELQILFGTELIDFKVESDKVILDVEKALSIGQIVSELVSNAIKHSFDKGKEGTIKITLHKEEGKLALRVLNNGRKLPADVLETNSGLGISLLKTFTKQLQGEVALDPENGIRVRF